MPKQPKRGKSAVAGDDVQPSDVDDPSFELLPSKSKALYVKEWDAFSSYCRIRSRKTRESDFHEYFTHLIDDHLAPATLWQKYSMLNGVNKSKHSTPLQSFPRLSAMIKKYASEHGGVTKKSKTFTKEQLQRASHGKRRIRDFVSVFTSTRGSNK